jgi:hypothetical protein
MPRDSGASSNPCAIKETHAAQAAAQWLLDRPVKPGDDSACVPSMIDSLEV